MALVTAECDYCVRVTCLGANKNGFRCNWTGYRAIESVGQGCPACFKQVFFIEPVHHKGWITCPRKLNDGKGKEEQ